MRGDGCVACAVSDEVINGYFVIVLRLQEWTIKLDCYRGGREVFCLNRDGGPFSAIAHCLNEIACLHAGVAWDHTRQGLAQGDVREDHRGEQGCAGWGAVDLDSCNVGVSRCSAWKADRSVADSVNSILRKVLMYGDE